jgi:hypothetical protein
MKKLFGLLVITILITINGGDAVAQCVPKKIIDSCSVFPKDYIFTKARVIEIKNKTDLKNSIYSVILTKGNSYVITVCEGNRGSNQGPLVINLLDNKDRVLMSNHNIKTDKYYNKIIFNCNSSGTYNLSYLFNGGESKGCGVSAFGFQRR